MCQGLMAGSGEKEAPGSVSFRELGGLRRSGCSFRQEVKDGSEGPAPGGGACGSQVWEWASWC